MPKEPTYSKAEQAARMRDFEAHVRRARAAWRKGEAYVVMSYAEYQQLRADARRDDA